LFRSAAGLSGGGVPPGPVASNLPEAEPLFSDEDLIHRYTRADALRDGVLVDVSAVAREAGVRDPVASTRAAWERCVTVPPGVLCQDKAGPSAGVGGSANRQNPRNLGIRRPIRGEFGPTV
jgi:hypothetical protein